MERPLEILVADDDELLRWSVRSRLEEEGYAVHEAADGREALRLFWEKGPDLVLLDHRMPDLTGLQVLEEIRREAGDAAVVMMTAHGSIEDAVRAMKLGALDYLKKPVHPDELVLIVKKVLESARIRRELEALRARSAKSRESIALVGRSPAMREILSLVGKVSRSRAGTVLVQGESGTGKDLVAKAIHFGSSRAERPFVNITCSAVPDQLLESELFGYERGAFTDARSQKKGLIEIGDGGTIFLDEIGEMGLAVQAKLLRFLEDRSFRRLGGTRVLKVNVRVVAATNRDLESAVREGRFREDLYYRLNVIPIRLPPLRERPEDVPLLVYHFLGILNAELRRSARRVSPAAMRRLVAHDWPGNVRELRNVLERILILEDRETIEERDLPSRIGETDAASRAARTRAPRTCTLEEIETDAIRRALERCEGNQVRTARLLGISRDKLRYRMRKYGLR